MNGTATLRRLFAGIATDLQAVDRSFQERVTSGLDNLDALAAYALNVPGKRLRVGLTLLSGKLTEYHIEKLLPLSVALEMAHLATLVHDDIIDAAGTRRSQPKLNARYGDHLAILLGDYLLAKTAALAPEVEDHRINHLLADTVGTVCEGRMHEVSSTGRLDLSIDTYLERVHRKTACLVSACCQGGAIVGGGSNTQIAALHEYGLHLGMALQIADDALDYTGSRANIGMLVGSNLRRGLVTLPLICALAADHDGHVCAGSGPRWTCRASSRGARTSRQAARGDPRHRSLGQQWPRCARDLRTRASVR